MWAPLLTRALFLHQSGELIVLSPGVSIGVAISSLASVHTGVGHMAIQAAAAAAMIHSVPTARRFEGLNLIDALRRE